MPFRAGRREAPTTGSPTPQPPHTSNNYIVVGAGYGDEGKGATVSRLVKQLQEEGKSPTVVRFNGGHQCGHTVQFGEKRHIFSTFGSGTLQGAPTFYSKYCVFYPLAYLNELRALKDMGFLPVFYMDSLTPMTTQFDVLFNQQIERKKKHGSVGVGFGTTIQREEDGYHLFAMDMLNSTVLQAKLNNIYDYYVRRGLKLDASPKQYIDVYTSWCSEAMQTATMADAVAVIGHDVPTIFEGGQGILLDQTHGFFPNVTRSNTTSKNALEILKEIGCTKPTSFYYVTRPYATRHGNGFLSNEGVELSPLINNERETNVSHAYQGEFRKAPLDLDMLCYAIECDKLYHRNIDSTNLVVTCADQVPNTVLVSQAGLQMNLSPYDFTGVDTNIHSVLLAKSPDSNVPFEVKEGSPNYFSTWRPPVLAPLYFNPRIFSVNFGDGAPTIHTPDLINPNDYPF